MDNISEAQKQELASAASSVLRKNDRGEYSVPTHGLYPMQFNWDSAFASMGYRWLEPDRGWQEIEHMANAQQDDGRIPHIAFRGDHSGYFPGPEIWQCGTEQLPVSGLSNPPVLAIAARRMQETGSDLGEQRLKPLLESLAKWHNWFMRYRLHEASGAIMITHPWESGRDNLCEWDQAMQRVNPRDLPPYKRRDLEHVDAAQRPTKEDYDRYLEIVACGVDVGWEQEAFAQHTPFKAVDVGMTAILLRACRDLEAMLEQAGMRSTLDSVKGHIDRLEQGMDSLWNDDIGAYCCYDPVEQKHCEMISAGAFLAPLAGLASGTRHQSLMGHFDRFVNSHLPVASFDPDHAKFDHQRYWRGPLWMPVNLLIEIGLDEAGEHERAELVRKSSLSLMAEHGLQEYYSCVDGSGLGGHDFTWTAACALDWINQPRKRDSAD